MIDVDDAVRKAWKEVLAVDTLRDDDDFFDLGGDSLAAVVATQVLSEDAGIKVSHDYLLKESTLGGYIRTVRAAMAGTEQC